MRKAIFAWIADMYASHTLAETELIFEGAREGIEERRHNPKRRPKKGEPSPDDFRRWVVELARIKKLLQPLTSSKPKRRKWTRKNFDLDLKGWKYTAGMDLIHSDFVYNLDDEGFNEVTVRLSFGKTKTWDGWDGDWDENSYTLTVIAPSFPRTIDSVMIRKVLAGLDDALDHELIHVGQTIIEIGKGLGEEAGLPKKHLRKVDEAPAPKRRKKKDEDDFEHELSDVEFYTRLHDIVKEYKREVPNVPVAKREEFFQQFIQDDDWLQVLRDNAPRKYGKAVSELRKAVDEWLP